MTLSKAIITSLGLFSLMQTATAAPTEIQSNVTPDVLVSGLSIQTEQNFTGEPRNGKSTVYAKNAHSYVNGLCAFKGNFLVYNDSAVKPSQFMTSVSYNNAPLFVHNTNLDNAGIKSHPFTIYLQAGNNNVIKVHADQQNNIQETNEMNNHLTRRVNVIGKCEAQNKPLTPALNNLKTPVEPTVKQHKRQEPAAKLKGEGKTKSPEAKQGCAYDPNSARLPCSRKPTMKLINPFE